MEIAHTTFGLIILSMMVASIAWTVTQEEIFREPRELCARRSKAANNIIERKFFYVFTCEYCFSHWVTLGVLLLTGFRVAYDNWLGHIVAFFVLPWLANIWMSLYRRVRVEIKYENALAEKTKDETSDKNQKN